MTTSRKDLLNRLAFEPQASRAKDALVMVFDIEGFSAFYGQPDVQDYVARYMNVIFRAVSTAIDGGRAYWSPKGEILTPFRDPVHVKFLGDGALYLWTFNKGEREQAEGSILHLVNRMWNIKLCFANILAECAAEVSIADLPRHIRLGFAAGAVYQLNHKYTRKTEYVGYCINLAGRLQSYCRDLGFMASAKVGFTPEALEQHGYIKVVATRIRGFPREIVIVDRKEFLALDEKIRNDLFEPLPSAG